MKKRLLDDLDRVILERLSVDARVSNRKIAADLGVTEGTIRGRIRKLQDDGVIRIQAVTDLSDIERPIVAYIGISAEHGRVAEVAKKLAAMEGARFVATMLGRFNIFVISLVKSPEEVNDLVNENIVTIPGVRHTETSLGIKFIKYDYRWGRILSDDDGGD